MNDEEFARALSKLLSETTISNYTKKENLIARIKDIDYDDAVDSGKFKLECVAERFEIPDIENFSLFFEYPEREGLARYSYKMELSYKEEPIYTVFRDSNSEECYVKADKQMLDKLVFERRYNMHAIVEYLCGDDYYHTIEIAELPSDSVSSKDSESPKDPPQPRAKKSSPSVPKE
jgi:hypothetical protein